MFSSFSNESKGDFSFKTLCFISRVKLKQIVRIAFTAILSILIFYFFYLDILKGLEDIKLVYVGTLGYVKIIISKLSNG